MIWAEIFYGEYNSCIFLRTNYNYVELWNEIWPSLSIHIAIYYKYYIMGCLLSNTIIWSIVTLITRTANPSWKWGGRLTAGRIGRQNRTPNFKAWIYLNFSKKYLIILVKQWLFDLSICSNLKKCDYFSLFKRNLFFKTIFANFTFHQMEVIFEPNSTWSTY